MKEKVLQEDHSSLRDIAALLHVKKSTLRYYKIMKVGERLSPRAGAGLTVKRSRQGAD